MAPSQVTKSSPIVIIGAGIFGLSTAIHLAQRGYRDVKVVDKQQYESTKYSYDNGCDAASADVNKIIRCAYGSQTEYQNLALDALKHWDAWNSELANGTTVPPGLTTRDRVWTHNGNLSMTDQATLPPFEQESAANITAAGYGDAQFAIGTLDDESKVARAGLGFALDPFYRRKRGEPFVALLDMAGGVAHAEKACRFALEKAKKLGVRFILGDPEGIFESFTHDKPSNPSAVTGVRTKDGLVHHADLTIAAAGGWTPSIVPELDGLCETTAGSVALIKIPRSSPLFTRLSPANFPTWTYKIRDGAEGGLYGFPCDEHGYLKIGYRGTKYTNPQPQADGKERSVPVTAYTSPQSQAFVPKQALKVIKRFLADFLPEIGAAGLRIERTRLCWYTDSFDNHFVIDRVRGRDGIMVATGGSGHAFKLLPTLGRLVVDVIEGVEDDQVELRQRFRWRELGAGQSPANVLMEGREGRRALWNVELCDERDFELGSPESSARVGERLGSKL